MLRDAQVDFLIGIDFLRRFDCELSFKDNLLRMEVRGKRYRVPLASNPDYMDVHFASSSSSSCDGNKMDSMEYGDNSGDSYDENSEYGQDISSSTSKSSSSSSSSYNVNVNSNKRDKESSSSFKNDDDTGRFGLSMRPTKAKTASDSYKKDDHKDMQDDGDFESPAYPGISMEGV